MRGEVNPQSHLFSYFSPENRVPKNHPLRAIKHYADEALASLRPSFRAMYSDTGRPSIPPERLLKASLLIAFYSVRSDRLFCEMLDYNILFRWFLDMNLEEASFDASTFSKNRERLIEHETALEFFDAVVRLARQKHLLSDEHFSVDGTLIEAWASAKCFQRKGKKTQRPPDDPGNPTIDFHKERRSNATHESTTDPEAQLARKGAGKEAKLSFCGNALMENRHGLLVDIEIRKADGVAEREGALDLLKRQCRKRVKPKTLGADKGYHTRDFVARLRKRGIAPHIACIENRKTPGMDGRTTRHESYAISQQKRKRVEEIFGWLKTVGGLRKSRLKGIARTQLLAHLHGAAYNLLRIGRLCPVAA
jgi:transposase